MLVKANVLLCQHTRKVTNSKVVSLKSYTGITRAWPLSQTFCPHTKGGCLPHIVKGYMSMESQICLGLSFKGHRPSANLS